MKRYKYSPEDIKLMENSDIPFAIFQFVDKKLALLCASDGLLRILGVNDRQDIFRVVETDMYKNAHPEDIPRLLDAANRFISGAYDYSVIYRHLVNGSYRVIKATGKRMEKPGGYRLAMVWYEDAGPYYEDLSDAGNVDVSMSRAVHESAMAYNSNYDHLTGLPNMNYFFEHAEDEYRRIREMEEVPAMLFFDLSGMKAYNQKHGLAEGDEMLRQLSGLLAENFGDKNCSRLNGDHFAAITMEKGLDQKLETLINSMPDLNDGKSLPLRIGVYASKEHNVVASIACDRAKMACDSTRNTYVSGIKYFDEKMLHTEEMRRYVTFNLDRALSEGWIKVYHQPIVRAANGRVSDEEALARWVDPERGVLVPDEFIHILEDARLIYKLDLYVTDKIIEKMKDQKKHGLHVVPESVNLSRADFYSCDIVEEIRKRVDDAGIDHSRLTIEITESMVGSDVEYMRQQIERFQSLGFKVWMDDYGNGYSSPEVLQRIHFDTVKFDMQFMRSFNNGNAGRIILTELIKMAISLGMETVVEGVETLEQVEFLKEIGCTKLQGYYYTHPIPFESILERNRQGTQIGFENPDESEYYAAIGRVSLYDMSVSSEDEDEYMKNYFNTMPMAIMELNEKEIWIARANKPYKEFFASNFFADASKPVTKAFDELSKGRGSVFQRSMKQCAADGQRVILDERMPDGSIMHVFIRRVAINPVTGVTALAVVILGVTKKDDANALTYTYVAQALSSDYINLFYVDLDNDEFIEYGSGDYKDDLAIERHGSDFFGKCYKNALLEVYEEDREAFLEGFTKDKIINALAENDSFTLTYRIVNDDIPVYVHLKAVRIKEKGNKIIIGISNIDAQKKQQESFERIKEEQITFSRISALSGDLIFIFAVDPISGEYNNFSSRENIENYGFSEPGEDFFGDLRKAISNLTYVEDLELVRKTLTKENILNSIEHSGGFSFNFRVIYEIGPVYVNFKAAMVEEKDGNRLIVGLSNINEQVKREQEYVNNLTTARNEANRDALTGVKNKHAYIDIEAQLDSMIEENNAPDFAVVVLDINGLKQINDTLGHQAGDEHIKKACDIICEIFRHSPVYRVGGDEFAIIAQGGDYKNMDKLMELMEESNLRNMEEDGVVIACGLARYHGEKSVSNVFDKADGLMYENKHMLKERQQM